MRILLVQAHPRQDSVISVLGRGVRSTLSMGGHDVLSHDLYEENFDPVIVDQEITGPRQVKDSVIHRHSRDLAFAEGIILIHPLWWGQPPAIMKGWVDRVFRPGVAYDPRHGNGLLRARTALIFTTSNQHNTARAGILLEALWRDQILKPCGVEDVSVTVFGPCQAGRPGMHRHWMEDARGKVEEAFPRQDRDDAGAFAG